MHSYARSSDTGRNARSAHETRLVRYTAALIALVTWALPALAMAQMASMPGMTSMGRDTASTDAVSSAMGAGLEESAHMRMTRLMPPARDDAARAAQIAATLREALQPYADYHRALADGFHIFAPRVKQSVYHFTSRRNAIMAQFRFDPAAPTSLLYERTGDSSYRLVGAMYTAPRRASLEQLNARVPLSVAQWHVHTNWCLPLTGAPGVLGTRGPDGRPLFGGEGSITTKEACTAAGGYFFPQVFGWMVHVYPFATDPTEVWSDDHMHS